MSQATFLMNMNWNYTSDIISHSFMHAKLITQWISFGRKILYSKILEHVWYVRWTFREVHSSKYCENSLIFWMLLIISWYLTKILCQFTAISLEKFSINNSTFGLINLMASVNLRTTQVYFSTIFIFRKRNRIIAGGTIFYNNDLSPWNLIICR